MNIEDIIDMLGEAYDSIDDCDKIQYHVREGIKERLDSILNELEDIVDGDENDSSDSNDDDDNSEEDDSEEY